MDFPVTRAILESLPGWVDQFTAQLPIPEREALDTGGFRWRHQTQDHRTLLVTKAVRIASGLRAAMLLADAGHTVEAASVLRTVADFSAEVMFICEGLARGSFTREQEQFIDQHHAPHPGTPEEFAERERDYYVGRRAIAKAHRRLAETSGGDADQLDKLSAFLNKGYDSYVHGKYDSAMELFSGETGRFMMKGTESAHNQCVAKVSVAGKLGEALNALRLMAMTWPAPCLAEVLRDAFDQLTNSQVDRIEVCPE